MTRGPIDIVRDEIAQFDDEHGEGAALAEIGGATALLTIVGIDAYGIIIMLDTMIGAIR